MTAVKHHIYRIGTNSWHIHPSFDDTNADYMLGHAVYHNLSAGSCMCIIHVYGMCMCMVWFVWSGRCVFNEKSETLVHIRSSADNCHHYLLPVAACKWEKHLITVTLSTACSQEHVKNPGSASLSYPYLSSDPCVRAGNVCSHPADYNSAALYASFTQHLPADSDFSVQLIAHEFQHAFSIPQTPD